MLGILHICENQLALGQDELPKHIYACPWDDYCYGNLLQCPILGIERYVSEDGMGTTGLLSSRSTICSRLARLETLRQLVITTWRRLSVASNASVSAIIIGDT